MKTHELIKALTEEEYGRFEEEINNQEKLAQLCQYYRSTDVDEPDRVAVAMVLYPDVEISSPIRQAADTWNTNLKRAVMKFMAIEEFARSVNSVERYQHNLLLKEWELQALIGRGLTKDIDKEYDKLIKDAEGQHRYDVAAAWYQRYLVYRRGSLEPTEDSLRKVVDEVGVFGQLVEKDLVSKMWFGNRTVNGLIYMQRGVLKEDIGFERIPDNVSIDPNSEDNPVDNVMRAVVNAYRVGYAEGIPLLEKALAELRTSIGLGRNDLKHEEQSILLNLSMRHHLIEDYEPAYGYMMDILSKSDKVDTGMCAQALSAMVYAGRYDEALDYYELNIDILCDFGMVRPVIAYIHLCKRDASGVWHITNENHKGESAIHKALYYCVGLCAWLIMDLEDPDNLFEAKRDLKNAKRATQRLGAKKMDMDYTGLVDLIGELLALKERGAGKPELQAWRDKLNGFSEANGPLTKQYLIVMWLLEEVERLMDVA